jgi:hypothetical protein
MLTHLCRLLHDPIYWGRIQRKTWCVGPYAGVDYNLTLSTPTSTPTHLPNATQCQTRLYPPVRGFGFGLWTVHSIGHISLVGQLSQLPSW